MDVILLVLITCLTSVLFWYTQCRRPKNIPPGPRGLPLVGCIPLVKKIDPKPYKALVKLSQTYGPVSGLYMAANQLLVSVCGYDAVREALKNDDLSGRPDTPARRERTFGKRLGLMFVDGDFFQEQRRFTLRHLKDLGFGRTTMEDMIHEEVGVLISLINKKLTSSPDNIVNFKGIFNLSTLNILWALVAGERFSREDPRLQLLLNVVHHFNTSFKPMTAYIPVPKFLIKLFPKLREIIGIRNDIFEPLQDFLRTSIEEHMRTRSKDDPRDFFDVFLNESEKQKVQNPNTGFHQQQLISMTIELFIGGSETSSNAIGFTLLYLIHYPHVQKKMQAELDAVCGDALPSLVHRPSLTYCEAVLTETLRFANITPMTLMHCAMKDTKLKGYDIPKGSLVAMNLYSLNMDEKYWIDPHVYRPERHLDPEGVRLIKQDQFMPFGAGKRQCLGEPLARISFYLFATALVKTFTFQAVPDTPLPTLEPIGGVTSGYQGFHAIVTPRS